MEIKILERLNKKDERNEFGVVQLLEHFHFRRHVVLVFEVLDCNLHKFIS